MRLLLIADIERFCLHRFRDGVEDMGIEHACKLGHKRLRELYPVYLPEIPLPESFVDAYDTGRKP